MIEQIFGALLIVGVLLGGTFYFTFGDATRVIEKPKPRYTWPDTASPDQSGVSGGLVINGTPYLKKEVEPGKWQWAVDKNAMRAKAEQEDRREALWAALRTRVLTDDEMKEVLGYGDLINVQELVPYVKGEKDRERADAFVTQMRLRAAAAVVNEWDRSEER